MKIYLPPLSVVFVWHPADEIEAFPIVEHCFSLLSRDIKKPYSRSMNLPIFFRTSSSKNVPAKIEIKASKTMVFIFIGKELVADDDWVDYIKAINQTENFITIPIAMDKFAFGLKNIFSTKNFIRTYEFNCLYKKEYMFISITHEIYRWALNEFNSDAGLGKDYALKIFLSHTKDGENGIHIAEALKKFTDNSQIRSFFDATDIAVGYKFDNEIMKHLEESTLIAIHSDLYSSRYFCQREILHAKERNRPIIAIDTIDEFEDRRFPFAANVPGIQVHFDSEVSKNDLLRILSLTLLETVRFYYAESLINAYIEAEWINKDEVAAVLSRPPEVSDIEKILTLENICIKNSNKTLVYPDPPLYNEELNFLDKLGIKTATPLTFQLVQLEDMKIGISISDLSDEELINIGHNNKHLAQLSQDISRHLLARHATLIYGGDLRPSGFTEFIFEEATVLKTRMICRSVNIRNYIAWPIYKNDTELTKTWKAKYRDVAEMVEVSPPIDVDDLIPSKDHFLKPQNIENSYIWSRCLTEMRCKMIEYCDVRICAGGRHYGYKGKMPGVLEEILISIEMKRPLFLLGGFGGLTSSVCELIKTGIVPTKLTQDWQIENNPGYNDLLEYITKNHKQHSFNYETIIEILKIENLNNGLCKEDNYLLFNTPFIDEALHLIFKGFNSLKL